MSIWTQLPPEVDTAAAQAAVDAAQAQLAVAQTALEQAEHAQPPTDPASADIVAYLAKEAHASHVNGKNAVFTSDVPVYYATADDPLVPVRQKAAWGASAPMNKALALAGGVRIPAAAAAGHDTDHAMCVIDEEADTYFEGWICRKQDDGSWTIAWGGITNHWLTFSGVFDRDAWPGLSATNWGASASSIGIAGGLVTYAEFKAGVIPHALTLLMPFSARGRWSLPAQRTDGDDPNPNAVLDGSWFRLRPDFDTSAITHPFVRMLAVAAQKYGIHVRDQTWKQVAVDLMPTNRAAGEPGWPAVIPNYWGCLKSFPWADLMLTPMDVRPVPSIAVQ